MTPTGFAGLSPNVHHGMHSVKIKPQKADRT
jgi:hypothetical protein